MDRRFLRHDPALAFRRLALVAFDHVHARDQHAFLRGVDAHDLARLALIAARGDDHAIALPDFCGHQSTSGASEMIFIWFLARSSRVTGPKIRVPIGSFWLLTSTAALPSKRISEPSRRRTPWAVRPTTAFTTSPFFAAP